MMHFVSFANNIGIVHVFSDNPEPSAVRFLLCNELYVHGYSFS